MLYNPFMPSVHFADRAVFGGGGGPAPVDPQIAIRAAAAAKIAAEAAKKAAAEKAAREAAAKKALELKQTNEATAAGTSASEFATGVTSDVSGSAAASQNKVNTLQLELIQLQQKLAQPAAPDASGKVPDTKQNPKLEAAIKAKQEALSKAQQDRAAIGGVQAQELMTAQAGLVSDAATDPTKIVQKQTVDKIDADAAGTSLVAGTGKVGDPNTVTATTADATTAAAPTAITAESVLAKTAGADTKKAMDDLAAAKGTVSDDAKVTAAQGDSTKLSALDLKATQIDKPQTVVAPPTRVVEQGEMIEGSAVDMAAVNEAVQVEAATAQPSKQATVKGQLSELMQDFEGGETPAWAAGAMRAATASMISRGIGASSMAGQAIVQAAMESALPIASQDSATFAKFESQNLSNRQQTAMFAGEQRAKFLELDFNQEFQTRVANASKISDIANTNFTAEQQIALENARMAQTVDLTNMSATNAKMMADAAAMSQMDLTNLSNQQQAAVQNAQNFMQMDMANLSNEQQTSMFKAQAIQQSILSDTAAENAARQFNASSENQTKQFMSSMETQVSQFNATQTNAMSQFNAGETNAIAKFNSEVKNQRDQFNATNALVIAQANAQWRQNTSTINTAAQNTANANAAATANGYTASVIDQVWQRERDMMAFAFTGADNEQERMTRLLLGDKDLAGVRLQMEASAAAARKTTQGEIFGKVLGIGGGGDGPCCFIMLEARYGDGTMDKVVRQYRDEYMTDKNRRGYYKLAEVLVPLMRKSKVIKWVVTKTFADPLVSYGKYHYGQNKHGVLYSPIKSFWMRIFDTLGGETKFIRENGEVV